MNILFLRNNIVSDSLFSWLKENTKDNIAIFDDVLTKDVVEEVSPDMVISYNYKHIISKEVLECLGYKVINLHISLLPWNRGAYPNIWSFLEDTPKGVSIHVVDEGVDTGLLLLQKEMCFDERNETLSSTYMKLHEAIQDVFKKNWKALREWEVAPRAQKGAGSFHSQKDCRPIEDFLKGKGWDMSIAEFRKNIRNLRKELNQSKALFRWHLQLFDE